MCRKLILTIALAAACAIGPAWAANEAGQGKGTAMIKIQVIIGNEVLPATLYDSPSGRDFAAMLPLDLTLRDYHGIEKIADLPQKLDTSGAPASYAPKPGDITLYAPWGNLAIFAKPFQNSAGLVLLGTFDGPVEGHLKDGPARIERAD